MAGLTVGVAAGKRVPFVLTGTPSQPREAMMRSLRGLREATMTRRPAGRRQSPAGCGRR